MKAVGKYVNFLVENDTNSHNITYVDSRKFTARHTLEKIKDYITGTDNGNMPPLSESQLREIDLAATHIYNSWSNPPWLETVWRAIKCIFSEEYRQYTADVRDKYNQIHRFLNPRLSPPIPPSSLQDLQNSFSEIKSGVEEKLSVTPPTTVLPPEFSPEMVVFVENLCRTHKEQLQEKVRLLKIDLERPLATERQKELLTHSEEELLLIQKQPYSDAAVNYYFSALTTMYRRIDQGITPESRVIYFRFASKAGRPENKSAKEKIAALMVLTNAYCNYVKEEIVAKSNTYAKEIKPCLAPRINYLFGDSTTDHLGIASYQSQEIEQIEEYKEKNREKIIECQKTILEITSKEITPLTMVPELVDKDNQLRRLNIQYIILSAEREELSKKEEIIKGMEQTFLSIVQSFEKKISQVPRLNYWQIDIAAVYGYKSYEEMMKQLWLRHCGGGQPAFHPSIEWQQGCFFFTLSHPSLTAEEVKVLAENESDVQQEIVTIRNQGSGYCKVITNAKESLFIEKIEIEIESRIYYKWGQRLEYIAEYFFNGRDVACVIHSKNSAIKLSKGYCISKKALLSSREAFFDAALSWEGNKPKLPYNKPKLYSDISFADCGKFYEALTQHDGYVKQREEYKQMMNSFKEFIEGWAGSFDGETLEKIDLLFSNK